VREFDETMRAAARTLSAESGAEPMLMLERARVARAQLAVYAARHRRLLLQAGTGLALVGAVALAPAMTERVRGPAETVVAYNPADDLEARSNAVFDALDEYLQSRNIELAAGTYAQRFRIPAPMARSIIRAAQEQDISPDVAFGLVRAESSFRPRVVSSAGAVGLTQVLPSTGRWIVPGTTRRDLMDPETNLRVGFRYLRYLIDKYDGDEALALTAYNRGPGTVDRHLRQGRNPDNGYVEMVLTGRSRKHTNLMNARFGNRRS
jgi:soluble lytic murein transglycosylase-like protein